MENSGEIYRLPRLTWALVMLVLGISAVLFHAGFDKMVDVWIGSEEYSHSLLIPLVAGFLVWQRRDALALQPFMGAWAGLGLVAAGLGLLVLGRLATLFVIQQYALLIVIYGLVLAVVGWRALPLLAVPLALLLSMVPLPQFLLRNFSAELQLLSTHIGVAFMRLAGVSVLVEGNVIDLGSYRLEVAEACSGLRYLFPLMTLGLVVAYFFQAPMWQRLLVFASSVPVTILMNSFRIGAIGVLVEQWGRPMAEGFLHDFEGWAVFMASIGVLLLEVRLLALASGDRRPWRQVFGVQLPPPPPAGAPRVVCTTSRPLIASAVLLVVFAAVGTVLPQRISVVPEREAFAEFPLRLGDWSGQRQPLDQVYLNQLQLDDYVVADFASPQSTVPVNFYVAWYNSQVAGESAHSPRSCIPGGGWRITDFSQQPFDAVQVASTPLRVNRAVIESGTQRQVVYYWFQQRGRVITNEYLLKWFLLVDAIERNRTDGALVRTVVPLRPGQTPQDADAVFARFAATVAPVLDRYIPR